MDFDNKILGYESARRALAAGWVHAYMALYLGVAAILLPAVCVWFLLRGSSVGLILFIVSVLPASAFCNQRGLRSGGQDPGWN